MFKVKDGIKIAGSTFVDGSKNVTALAVTASGTITEGGTALSSKYLGITANAASAAVLATSRNINGVGFNGSADITIPRVYDSNYISIINPSGATYSTQTNNVTGAITITLPVGMVNTMIRMTIKVYEYAANCSFNVYCGGYTYSSGNTWANNPFAYIIGNPGTDRRFNVRFGYTAGGKAVVYIGELTSTWLYPQVAVTDVQCGFNGQSVNYTTGWTIGFQATAFENVTATITNPQIGYSVSTNTANSVVLRDGSGNFSAGTITAALSGNATSATTATNVAGGSIGTIPYQSASGTTAMLAVGTAGQVLKSNGAAAPSWVTLVASDVGAATSGHSHGLVKAGLTAPGAIDALTTSNFRTTLFGATTSGENITTARWNTVPTALSGLTAYGTMMAWSASDTQGFVAINYDTAGVMVGGGNTDKINWTKSLSFTDHNHDGTYLKTAPVTSVNGSTGAVTLTIPTKTSQLTNDSGFVNPSGSVNYASSSGNATAVVNTVTGTNSAELVRGNMADNDFFRILVGGTGSNSGFVEIATADDATEPIYVRQYSGTFSTLTRTATLLDGSGNTSFPGTVYASFSGGLSGTATYASKLRRYPENDQYWISSNWTGNIRGMKIIANNDNGDNQAYIHNTSVDYSEYCLHSGANPAFTWSGSISSNTEPTITHNLGYNPIVMASGSLGNVNLNINHYSTSAVTVSNWNSGGNTWSGIILCY